MRFLFSDFHPSTATATRTNQQAAKEMGIPTLPPTLTEDIANDQGFLDALNHILFHVHLVQGLLTCPVTEKEFMVQNGIPNMMLDEEECEAVRF